MRLVTLNVWGTRGDWSARLPVLQREFRNLEADIVTLQETMLTDSLDQVREMLGTGYHLAQQRDRESGRSGAQTGQGITTASKWPFGRVLEIDLHVTERTHDFACTCLVTEVLAPHPTGRIWVANHFPDYQLDHERERRLQSLAAARKLELLVADSPGHVIVSGDMDADSASDSMRFWTGRHVIDDTSVCYRNAWDSVHPDLPLASYVPDNPNQVDPDWPFRNIDHVLIRCDRAGPTLSIDGASRLFDHRSNSVSDHYGLAVELNTLTTDYASPLNE